MNAKSATVVESRLRLSDVCGGLRSDDAKLRFLCSSRPLPALWGWPAELIMESCPGELNYSFSSQLQGVPSLETWHMRDLLHGTSCRHFPNQNVQLSSNPGFDFRMSAAVCALMMQNSGVSLILECKVCNCRHFPNQNVQLSSNPGFDFRMAAAVCAVMMQN